MTLSVSMKNEMNKAALELLEHWMKSAPDEEHGGFYNVNCWNEVMTGGEKSATLNFRIFWTYTQAYLFYGDKRYLAVADRAYDYVVKHFLDREYGGVYPILSAEGEPISTDKQGYVHSFAIAAFAAYYRATKRSESLQHARSLFGLVEARGKNEYDGYHDVCSRDWTPTAQHTQSDTNGEPRDKSLRPNMHLLWGFEELRLAWTDDKLDEAIVQLALLLSEKLTDRETGEVGQAFSGDWNRVSDRDDYGDDFELAWILWDALPALRAAQASEQVDAVCGRIARHAMLSGVDREFGGIYQQYHHGRINTEKEWWVQAEAINGLLSAWQHTGDAVYMDEAAACWRFVRDHMVQPDGTWKWKTKRNGRCFKAWEIRGPLMCPYHSGRMLMRSVALLGANEQI